MGKKTTLALCLALSALILAPGALADERKAASGPMPAFQLNGISGKRFSSKSLRGKVAIITFWRLGQRYSEKILKELIALKASHPTVQVVSIVSGDANPAEVKVIAKKFGLTFPVLLDPKRVAYRGFAVIVAPSTWLIGKKGQRRFFLPSHRRDFRSIVATDLDFLLGKLTEAQRVAQSAPKAAPKWSIKGTSPRYRFGLRLLREGKVEEAAVELRKAWESKPPYPAAGVDLSFVLVKLGRAREAVAIAAKAAELAPKDPRAAGAKGLTLARTGKAKAGQPLIRTALESGARDPVLFYEMGTICEKTGAVNKACAYFRLGMEQLMGKEVDSKRLPPP